MCSPLVDELLYAGLCVFVACDGNVVRNEKTNAAG